MVKSSIRLEEERKLRVSLTFVPKNEESNRRVTVGEILARCLRKAP